MKVVIHMAAVLSCYVSSTYAMPFGSYDGENGNDNGRDNFGELVSLGLVIQVSYRVEIEQHPLLESIDVSTY